jgi:hypothetical protein
MRQEAKVVIFEAGAAFLLAMIVCAIVVAIAQGVIGSLPIRPSHYWLWAWIVVFLVLWSMRQWFMPTQWSGRDLKGSSRWRFSAFLALFVIADLSIWFLR